MVDRGHTAIQIFKGRPLESSGELREHRLSTSRVLISRAKQECLDADGIPRDAATQAGAS